jgi:hypothetical protein
MNGAECVFTYTDENGICKSAIEKAFRAGKTDFYKPISCHLYPVSLQIQEFTAVNYHRWKICNCARSWFKLNVPVYRFLKNLGQTICTEWYDQLDCSGRKEKQQ